ncbi:MAG TPA: copper chaperone PCu(A)C [Burkholderiales bacterium]|nr:copper chaperone PCu(A)C [Burkholderiales bacterium]
MRFLFFIMCLFPAAAFAQVEIENAWSRATPPGAKVAAGYLTIRNKSTAADRLVGASSPAAARVETHVNEKQGEVMRMREVKGYEVPAKGSFELKPGGAHLMLVDVRRPFKEGDRIPLVLRFQNAGEIKTELEVKGLGAQKGHAH